MYLLSMGKRKAGFLRFMARELSADLICRLYVSCVRPVLEYASPVWHGDISRQHAIALERIQASVARRVLKAPWRTPKQVQLERLQWPSLFWRHGEKCQSFRGKLAYVTIERVSTKKSKKKWRRPHTAFFT